MHPHNKLKNLDVVWLPVFEEEELQGCVGIMVLRGGGLREPTDPTICSTLQDCFLGALECFLCFGKFIFGGCCAAESYFQCAHLPFNRMLQGKTTCVIRLKVV